MANLGSNLRSLWEGFVDGVGGYLPNLAFALAILIVGWLAALLISKIVQAALRKTTLDNRIVGWVKGESETLPDIEPAIGKGVFWLVMLFVFVAFFQALRLTAVTGPLTGFLNQIFEYLPRLLGAAALLLLAWLLAAGVRLLVRAALKRVRLDERIGSGVGAEDEAEAMSVSAALSDTAYWLILLVFLPAILGVLGLDGLLGPVESMVERVVAFLPNLLAAAAIFIAGWFAARILQRILTNLLAALGLDNLGERAQLKEQRLSKLVGLLAYSLILIVALILALDALKLEAITEPASAMLNQILEALPSLFVAALLLAVFYIAARIVAGLVTGVLGAVGFSRFLAKLGLPWKAEGEEGRASVVVGHLVVVVIMLFAAVQALELVNFNQLAALVSAFLVFLGNVLLGLVIVALGLYLANLAATTIRASGSPQSGILASVARAAILVLAGAMALRQMNVAEDIINLSFGLLLGAVAVAAAVAFGIGGRDLARQQLERWYGSLRTERSDSD